jgi:hypothetical protein
VKTDTFFAAAAEAAGFTTGGFIAAGEATAADSEEFSATAAEPASDSMIAEISSLDCSIISFTLGENLTPAENSPVSLFMSGPLADERLAPSWSCKLGVESVSMASLFFGDLAVLSPLFP